MEEFIKAIARPVVTLIIVVVMAIAVLKGITLPEWFLGMGIPVVGWWFAERMITHVRQNNSAGIDKLAERVASAIKAKE